jgi:hypothetical protein
MFAKNSDQPFDARYDHKSHRGRYRVASSDCISPKGSAFAAARAAEQIQDFRALYTIVKS